MIVGVDVGSWPSRRWAPPCGRSTACSATGRSPGSPTPSSSTGSCRRRRRRLRGAGGAARADGPVRLPGRPARPQRRRGRLPGHLPDPGQEGPHDPGRARPGGLAVPGRAPRRDPGQRRRGPASARSEREAGQMTAATASSGPGHPGRTACRPCTRRSPGCPRTTAWPSSSATWKASPRPRPPGSCAGASAPCAPAGRGPRPAQGPAGPPRPGMRRGGHGGRVPPRGRDARPAGLERRDRPGGSGPSQSDRRRRGRLGRGAVPHPGGAQDHVRPEADDRLGGPPGRRADGVGGLGRPGPAGR